MLLHRRRSVIGLSPLLSALPQSNAALLSTTVSTTMSRLSFSSSPLVVFFFLLLLLTILHSHPTHAQINCDSVSCAPDYNTGCIACNLTSTRCQSAWYAQPGFSCGTAIGRSPNGRTLYNAQCCPNTYNGQSFHCAPQQYSSVVGGVQYEVSGFSCVKDGHGLGAGAVVGVVVAAVMGFVMVMVACGYVYRRRAVSRVPLTPLAEAGEEDGYGGYVPPMVQAQAVQPFSSQAYRLDAAPQHVTPPYSVQMQYGQPPSTGNPQDYQSQ